MVMKTLQEIKEEVAISKGFLSWNNFLKNEPIWENINKSYDEAAEVYASQFKQEWVKIDGYESLPKSKGNFFVFDKPTQSVLVAKLMFFDKECWIKNVSHYMPIELPLPPTK